MASLEIKVQTMTTKPLVIAHRGHSLRAPEQTKAAFTQAVKYGADMIEADVRESADGTLVLMHDRTVDRTTDGTGAVSGLTDSELDRLDAGGWFSANYVDERIPTLDWLFGLAADNGVALCLEVKGEPEAEQERLANRIAEEIASRGRLAVDALASFDHEALKSAAGRVAGLRIAPDRSPERGSSTAEQLIAQAEAVGAPIIQHHCDDLTHAVVTQVQAAGIEIWAWPSTSEKSIRSMLKFGVAGIMGDDVETISRLVHEHIS